MDPMTQQEFLQPLSLSLREKKKPIFYHVPLLLPQPRMISINVGKEAFSPHDERCKPAYYLSTTTCKWTYPKHSEKAYVVDSRAKQTLFADQVSSTSHKYDTQLIFKWKWKPASFLPLHALTTAHSHNLTYVGHNNIPLSTHTVHRWWSYYGWFITINT